MTDRELISIAKQTARILKDANCGMGDVISVLMLLAYRVDEIQEENEHLKNMLQAHTKEKQ